MKQNFIAYRQKPCNVLSIIFILCNVYFGYSQNSYGDYLTANKQNLADEIITPTIQSPDVEAFEKATYIPADNYTGKVKISIPIYTIHFGGMEVPISLNYNTGGVKVGEMASSVGLNWSLNAGGVVSKLTQGLDDFLCPASSSTPSSINTPAGWLAGLNTKCSASINNPTNDALPDKFIVNSPGISTSFVTKKNGTPVDLNGSGYTFNANFEVVTKAITMRDGNPGTDSRMGLSSLDVTNLSGIKYHFETPDFTFSVVGRLALSTDLPTNHLDEMTNLKTDQSISFQYEAFTNYNGDGKEVYVTPYGGGSRNYLGNFTALTDFPLGHRLKQILFDTGSVEFFYGLDRQDYIDSKALTRIVVKDYNGKIIKDFRFSHSYFQSSINSSTPQSKRLRLDGVYEVDNSGSPKPGYVFTYNTDYEMPPRDSYAYDFLGYNNGAYSSSNTNPIPKMYYYDYRITPLYRSGSILLGGNFSMAANLNYARTYSLEKIELPTGGTKEFDYELNQFHYKGKTFSGGGLRVKSQHLKSSDGVEQILDYTYFAGKIERMPTYAVVFMKNDNFTNPTDLNDLTSQLGIDTFSSPRSQIELINGSFVGYNYVDVKNRSATGYTEYGYTNWSDTLSDKIFSIYNDVSSSWAKLNPNFLYVDNDLMRGKLAQKSFIDDSGRMLRHTEYLYEEEEIDSGFTGREFYNTVNNNCSTPDMYMYHTGAYITDNCGGFKEIIDLPVTRYLLRTIRTTDYGLDGQVKSWRDTEGFNVEKALTYDPLLPLVIKEVISNYGNEQYSATNPVPIWRSEKNISYPAKGINGSLQLSSYPYAQELVDDNRLSLPMEIEISGRSYSDQLFEYDQFSNGQVGLKKVSTKLRDNVELPSGGVIHINDSGRPTEILTANGRTISVIYGYHDSEIIAIVNGASYKSINSWLNTDYGKSISYLSQKADYDTNTSSENTLQSWLNNLRNSVGNHGSSSTTVKTVVYDPLLGVKRITDEKGITTYYNYDQFERLTEIKNSDSKLLKYYQYNYKN